MKDLTIVLYVLALIGTKIHAQTQNQFQPDASSPKKLPGMKLAWHDEFNIDGKPDPRKWKYESGFVRNQELQWYQAENANCKNGVLLIEGRREKISNPNFKEGSDNWKLNRQYAEYTAASIKSQGLHEFTYGRIEIRARVDTSMGSWPAIWTLGARGGWPLNGEVDIMEFYRVDSVPTILANLAWGRQPGGGTIWNTKRIPLAHFILKDKDWPAKFHVWRMDWTKDSIKLYLDDELLNTGDLSKTLNPDGSNPFRQAHYLLLNLAIGSNGAKPRDSQNLFRYEVDYVRYYQLL